MVAKKRKTATYLDMPLPSGVSDVLKNYADVFKPVLTGVEADGVFTTLAGNADKVVGNQMNTQMEALLSEIENQRTAARLEAERYTSFDQYVSPTTGVSGSQIILKSKVAGDSPKVTIEKVIVEGGKTFERRADGGFLGTGRGRPISKLLNSSYEEVSQITVSPTDATGIAELEKNGYRLVSTTERKTETETVSLSDLLKDAQTYLDGVQNGTIAVVSEGAISKAVAEWLANNTPDALKKAGEEAAAAVSARGLKAVANLELLGKIQIEDVNRRTNDAAEARRLAAYNDFDSAVQGEKKKYQNAEEVLRKSGVEMKALLNKQGFLSRALNGARENYNAKKEGDSLDNALVSYLETAGAPVSGATFDSYLKELEKTEARIKNLSSEIINLSEQVRKGKPYMDAIDAIYGMLKGALADDKLVRKARLERLQILQQYAVNPESDPSLTSYVSPLKKGK